MKPSKPAIPARGAPTITPIALRETARPLLWWQNSGHNSGESGWRVSDWIRSFILFRYLSVMTYFNFEFFLTVTNLFQSERCDVRCFALIRQGWIKRGSGGRNYILIGHFYMISISSLRGSPLKSIKSLFSLVTFIFMEVIWFMFFIFLIAVSSDSVISHSFERLSLDAKAR